MRVISIDRILFKERQYEHGELYYDGEPNKGINFSSKLLKIYFLF